MTPGRRRGRRRTRTRCTGCVALAVDAGVGPEVEEHDLALEAGQSERLAAAAVLNHRWVPVRAGAAPHEASSLSARRALGQVLVGPVVERRQLTLDRLRLGELLLDLAGVVRHLALDHVGDVERERDRQENHHHAAQDPEHGGPGPVGVDRGTGSSSPPRRRAAVAGQPRPRRSPSADGPQPISPVAPATVIAARIGPALGTYSVPRPSPSTNGRCLRRSTFGSR